MQKIKKKSAIMILMVLMLTIELGIPAVNTVNAQTTMKGQMFYPYIYVAPNPIGIGQAVNVGFGFAEGTNDQSYYNGWMLTVTNPSGQNKTLGPYSSDATGGTGISFTPDAQGIWFFQVYYPGGNITFLAAAPYPATTYYVPATYSKQVNLTVDTNLVSYPPAATLPTSYWQYPVYSDNAAWYSISGNWLMSGYDTPRAYTSAQNGVYNPYTAAPKSAHILWSEPWMLGGVASYSPLSITGLTKGYGGIQTYYTGASYREEVTPPIIINGRLYYNQVEPPAYGFYCLNLYNGQQIWFQNQTFLSSTGTLVQGTNAQLSMGQILTYDIENQNGAVPYLWSTGGTTWARYDAYTGNLLNTITDATATAFSGSSNNAMMYGPSGELLVYYFSQADKNSFTGNLILWNSSKAGLLGGYSQTQQLNIPWKNGIQWNITVPACPNEGAATNGCLWDPKNPTMLIITNQTNGNPGIYGTFQDIAYSTSTGAVLWSKIRNPDGELGSWERGLTGSRAMGDGIYTIFRKETSQIYAFNAATGDQLWVSESRPNALGMFATGQMFAYGLIYMGAYDGYVYAYNETTGKTVWSFYDGSVNPSGLEAPYGQYPLYGGNVIADGILFATNQEHTEQSPLFRGEAMYAVNASTGQLIWQIAGHWKKVSVAGGVLVAPNECDGQIYAFGLGPTKMTVRAPDVGVTTSAPITITGTVTDVSAGSQQQVVTANFPNGLPCVSDASMTQFMEAVYEQQTMPTNITGVPVTLSVLDSNGNYRQIGTTTSSPSGTFGFTWTPDIPGDYTVYANFAGSNSYYGSSAQTYFSANAPAATQAPAATPAASMVDTYFVPSVIAIIVAIAIVGAVTVVLLLRKRP